MREPEVLSFAGDWHSNTNWATHMIYSLKESFGTDTILHAGDYGYDFPFGFRDFVEDACIENDVMLYFVDGNHDDHEFIWSRPVDEDGLYMISEHVRAIPRGHRWQWWGKTFMGLGGAHSVDRDLRLAFKDKWWPTEWITDEQIRHASRPGEVDVVVAHDVPNGVAIPGITKANGMKNGFSPYELDMADVHRLRLGDVVDAVQPSLWVHGHYHVNYAGRRDDMGVIGLSLDGTSILKNTLTVKNVSELETLWHR